MKASTPAVIKDHFQCLKKGMATTIPENIYNINEKGFLELSLKLFALIGIFMRHALTII